MSGEVEVDPVAFARTIADTPDSQLEAGMRSEHRRAILDAIFAQVEAHFRGDRADGVDAVVHFKLLDRPDGGYDHYELVIRDGRCTLSERPKLDPRATIKVRPVDFLKLITGNANGPMLYLRRRLKVDGDLTLASRIAGMFSLPRA